MRWLLALAFVLIAVRMQATAQNRSDIDPRLTQVRSLHEGSNFTPPSSKEEWMTRAAYVREQVLLAAGLLPLPEKCQLNSVIHGRIEREDYTVEKVYFESYPGFYVSGSLYRPRNHTGPLPVVLSPHGHWGEPAGRFYQNSEKGVEHELKGGWEADADAARYPLQARCANLAKLGCIVFHYDMVGYADADQAHFPHRKTFVDLESAQYGLSIFGLQSWNSIRAVDFVLSLPDADPSRIACTGASGGGTQTFILMNTDPRLALAAPVCMISAGEHQGGCICENCYYLRLFSDNVEFAATFAPKPMVHPTSTGDWTAHFLEHGYPELKTVYRLFDAEKNVHSERYAADHNYNKKSRELVYNFINEHFKLGHPSPIIEQKFIPIAPKDLSVFTVEHPRPANAVDQNQLKAFLIQQFQKQIDGRDTRRSREVLGSALRHMMATKLPAPGDVMLQKSEPSTAAAFSINPLTLSRKGSPERLPAVFYRPNLGEAKGVTVVIRPAGKPGVDMATIIPLLKSGQIVLAPDVFLTGSLKPQIPVARESVEFFTGYNRTTLANRVHDILTAISAAQSLANGGPVNLLGLEDTGPWCILAGALCEGKLARIAADGRAFDFSDVQAESDDRFQPMAMRYGGLYAFASLCVPAELMIYHPREGPGLTSLKSAYADSGAAAKLRLEPAADSTAAVRWIVHD